MKTFKSFLIVNLVTLVIVTIVYSLLYCYVIFFYNPNIAFYPAQYFADTYTGQNSLIYSSESLLYELTFSPHTSSDLSIIISCILLLVPILTIVYYVIFFISSRKDISIKKRITILPITLIFFVVYIWVFVFMPKYIINTVLINLAGQMKEKVDENSDENFVTNEQDIISFIESDNRKLDIISGYGKYNIAFKNMTRNLKTDSFNYYNLMFIPTVARHLAITDLDFDDFKYPIIYYPESHRLVINEIMGADKFIEFLSLHLLRKLNYSGLNALIKQKGNNLNYKIISEDEYPKYIVKKYEEINSNNIKENNKIYLENLEVLNECTSIQKTNDELVKREAEDYQLNCVNRVRYRDCEDFKKHIDNNLVIRDREMLSCQIKKNKIEIYNKEINNQIEEDKKDLDLLKVSGTLKRNMSELSAGMFFQPSSIFVKYDKLVYPTITTSIHEYLHYIVGNSFRDLPVFIDEGMTEYLTMKSIGYDKYFAVAYSGYYAELQIIYTLLEKIPYDDLLSVYLSGRESDFKKLFEKYFPGINYSSFIESSNKIYNTTYEVNGSKRSINILKTRDYVRLDEVKEIRKKLDLDEWISYSELYKAAW